ncbi:SH3-binding domain protein 5-like, a [Chanos chanos]|uniref:SH3 domain-binding protein 5 n=1 Tax=Chanos chanos TaxID=29144 RepID=A0A6J2W2B8_CHACN|nr:SH3 domain-binding protein 5-like [Chanos chanos]
MEYEDRDADGESTITVVKETNEEVEQLRGERHEEHEDLDPRIQEELENLNEASEKINLLELELNEARESHGKVLSESVRKLNVLSTQLGGCIEKARPYYEARRMAKAAQQEIQRAALRYERAVSLHTAAREMVSVAEQGLKADKNKLDLAWQEMLNSATAKVNEAEAERLSSEQEHMRVSLMCQEAETQVQALQKSLKRAIAKSKPYFELKAQLNHVLEDQKSRVMKLEAQVAEAKLGYSDALKNLERISEEIHAQREQDQLDGNGNGDGDGDAPCGGRRPPVGAEANSTSVSNETGACADTLKHSQWTNAKQGVAKAMDWAERHRECVWGQREQESPVELAKGGSDSFSVLSLQTIVSDLEKSDSVEHLGHLSDAVSLSDGDSVKDEDKRGTWQMNSTSKQKQVEFLKQHQRSISL